MPDTAIARSLWVHGHTMNIEHPDRVASISRVGPYGRILGRSAQNTWVHFSVPAPVVVDGRRLSLASVMVRFRATTDAWIAAVHVFDGESRILTKDGLHDTTATWTDNIYPFPLALFPSIRRSVGISINVQFHLDPSGAGTNRFRFDFSSVGCNFVTPFTVPISV